MADCYDYLISVIMPTYNSDKTLEYSLKSIRNQNIDQTQIEILVIDGGSTDKTIEIAKHYGATVLYNERKLPEFAKQQGLLAAKGKYGIFIDSDEAFTNMNSLSCRIKLLKKYPAIKNLVSTGQICQKGENGVTRYANFIGDPFSNFVYRYNGYNRIEDLTKQYQFKDVGIGLVLDFSNIKFLPLFDALGNMFEIETARKFYVQENENQNFAANIFSNMVRRTKKAIIMKNDFICHCPRLTRKSYINKIKWRVKNNLFQTEGVGFSQRVEKEIALQKRKLLFIPYCLLIVPVLIDTCVLAIKNKDCYFLNHFWFAEYTFLTIVRYMFLKMIHYPVKMEKTYGKQT